ncbi:hypothetical protein AC26_2115 [Escherichia coli 1-176-05_S3_C2]|nr:hypothetical protein AC26_2115 [Escherichia coli 1-176-05_S3_C2]
MTLLFDESVSFLLENKTIQNHRIAVNNLSLTLHSSNDTGQKISAL